MDSSQLSLLRKFVEMCKADSNILHVADLAFYREYLESLGARIPPHRATDPVNEEAKSSKPTQKPPEPEPEEEEEEEIESDVELDNTGVITDEDEDMPEYADINTEVTDDMIDQASDKRNAAMDAAGEGHFEDAIQLYTEAIKLNPMSALLYAKRASVYLKMNKPKKAIHDSTKAIELNPDSAQGYKWRGKAQKMLGNWEDAYHDLTLAGKLDFDDDINEALHAVTPNAKKLMEHKRKYERIREEKELKKRKERIRKAREEYEKQKEEQSHHEGPTGGFPGFPGAFPGSTGGMPGMPDMASLLQDPELLAAFQDPEVSAAFQDVAANPANISKYQNNPRVQSVINKLAAKFGTGGSGMGRGGMGEGKV
ncbi:hsc70-interacting protein-like isoform X1 [Pomacea canaliculata]|uniref:hsc70-interacting protein-like isoform X1 n=1 Tax=Pomacea canaliculata TaxID=400727 RepID=UPI000D72E49C|nr:hsc70-interacting protein-like isoform X1 [Pomacea canaliculata]